MSVQKAPADPWFDPAGTRLVGDPVDVVTGRVTERTLCFRLIGPLFLELYRHYNSGHNTLQRGLGFGHTHSYDHRLSFDADGLLLEEPIGRRIGFPALRADGEMHAVRGATLQRLSLLGYRLTRPGDPAIDFVFADPARSARVTRAHRSGADIAFRYDPDGRLTGLTHSTGLEIVVEEDAAQRLMRLAGAWDGGEAERPMLVCEYNAAGDLVAMTDALERRGSFAYDEAHRLVRRTDRRGYSFLFEYDSAGRCVRSAGEDGVMGVVLRYRTEERVTEVTRSDGGKWTYHYNDAGSITHVTGPYGDVRQFIAGENGRTVGEIDPLGNGLDYVLDQTGALVGKRFATGRVIPVRAGEEVTGLPPHRVADCAREFLYGELPSRLPIAADALSDRPPELRRTLLPETRPLPPSPRVPPFGVLSWYPSPWGGREFNPFGHLTSQLLPSGGQRRWTYDPNDSVHLSRDADGAVIRRERRSWNQLETKIDPIGNATRYRFASEDRISAVTDPGGTATEYAHDKEGRLIGVRRAGQVRETYRYDGAGNLIEKRDSSGATLLTLIPTADRLMAERRLASGPVHSFSYDPAGRFLTASVDFSEVRFGYDAAGRCTLDSRDGKGITHQFSTGIDRQVTTVLDRFVIRHEQDETGVTLRLAGGAWLRIDRPNAHSLLRHSSNGTAELCQFDDEGRKLASAIVSGRRRDRQWLRRWRYSHEGDLQEADDDRSGATAYRYDAAHRLVTAHQHGRRPEAYEHDPAGNLIGQPGLFGAALGPGNRLTAANGEQFTYDVRHHVTERRGPRGVVRYHYDSRDMLVAVDGPDGLWQAEYDAIGRRVRAWQDGIEQLFFWDTDRLAAEVLASGMLRVYVYADPLALTPVAFLDYSDIDADPASGAVRFVYPDQRGAPVLVDDAQGDVLWQARLMPYGAASITAPAGMTLNLRFPGHYFDAATGLHYNRFRYYDPALGRYVQSDPLGLPGGMNVYAYLANPLVRVDVRGLSGDSGDACPNQSAPAPGQDKNDAEDEGTVGPEAEPGPPDPALARACGPPQEPWLIRDGEGQYPPEAREARPGQPMVLDPNESDTYLYAVLIDGTIVYAPQHVDDAGNELVKHTDLAENGPARVSGEIKYNPDQNEWGMDDQSGRYSTQPMYPGGPLIPTRNQDNVDAAAQLARNSGTQNDIVPVQREPPR